MGKNSSRYMGNEEFMLLAPGVMIFAPLDLTDEEGEKLYQDIAPVLKAELEKLKTKIELRFSNVRVGYSVE